MGVKISLTAQNSYAGTNQARVVPSTSYVPNRHKRSYEEDDEMDTQPQQMKDVSQGKKEKFSSSVWRMQFQYADILSICLLFKIRLV